MRASIRCRVVSLGVICTGLLGQPLSGQVMDREFHLFVQFDQMELRASKDARPAAWDVIGWGGGDFNRVWFRSVGELTNKDRTGNSEIELLFGRLIAPYWDLLVGGQLATHSVRGATRSRGSLAIGLEGKAPYWFEVEPTLYVSDRGDVSAELNVTYELFLTQRLIAQPRFDLRAAATDVPSFGIASGVNDTGLGLRLRYEFSRKFAPYVGVRWDRRLGGTADLARAAGAPLGGVELVSGVRAWF